MLVAGIVAPLCDLRSPIRIDIGRAAATSLTCRAKLVHSLRAALRAIEDASTAGRIGSLRFSGWRSVREERLLAEPVFGGASGQPARPIARAAAISNVIHVRRSLTR